MPVRGDLADMALDDLIQIHCQGGATCRISVYSNQREMRLFIADGEIVHADSKGSTGIEVVYRMIRTRAGGSFEVIPGEITPDRTIKVAWQNIIMEGMRLLDQDGPWINEAQGETDRLSAALELVFNQSEFEGLMLVSQTGRVVASHLPKGQDASRLGAVVIGIMNLSTRSLSQLEEGDHLQTVIGGMSGQVILTRLGEDYSLASLISEEDNLGMAFWEIKKGIDIFQQALSGETEG